ncbi:MAG: hypothetical protein AMXMBFR37_07270 [Steroidobacteraceae bacterium]
MSALKQIFVRVHFRYEQDLYAKDLEPFAAWLLDAGYPNKTCRTHLYRVQQALHAIGRPPGSILDEEVLQRTFHSLARRAWPSCHTHPVYAGYLRSAQRLAEPPPSPPDPLAKLVAEFCDRLIRRRGLSASTIAGYRHWISDFLRLNLRRGQLVSDLSHSSVESYVQSRAPTLATRTFRCAIRCIFTFLKDCHGRGLLAERLDDIDLPRGFRPEQPPRALPWHYVQPLLRSIDRSVRAGTRDYAILHLMAHYGIRTGEITVLRLASINWSARTLTVCQPKTHSTLVLPLHAQTLRILKDYVARSRPQTTLPWLFLRGAAPLAPMTKYSVSFVFKTRARRSGLPIAQYSSYSLRHGFAQRLFEKGVGMKAIGDLMGHRNLVSTSVYLRLQSAMLREVALPVPGVRERTGGVA